MTQQNQTRAPTMVSSPTVITYCYHLLFSLFSPPVLTLLTCCHVVSPVSPSHFSLSACSHSLTLSLSLTSRQSDSHLQTNTVSKHPTSTLPSLSVYLLLTPLHSTVERYLSQLEAAAVSAAPAAALAAKSHGASVLGNRLGCR